MASNYRLGGVIHAYQKYDPVAFPSPTQEPPDLVGPAFEHAMMFGGYRELTEEELARAVRLDPSQIAGLGPSLDHLRQLLEERKRKILEQYETETVQKTARRAFHRASQQLRLPGPLKRLLEQAVNQQQLFDLEQLWYRLDRDNPPAAGALLQVMERLGEKFQVEELAQKYAFTGRESLTVPRALEVKKELEMIDELLKQLEEAAKTAQIGIIDMDALSQFAPEQDLGELEEIRRQVENLVREMAERQGLERNGDGRGFRLTPQAYRVFQGRLLERIFSNLQPSKTGRHPSAIAGEGAVELQQTKPYEFGDSLANVDLPQTIINTLLSQPTERPLRLRSEHIEVHRTRNQPKCATVVVMDMSGSMRYDGQYINVKRMGLALQALIQREYPGDFLRFIEMYSFAKLRAPGEIIEMMPKPVTIHQPTVQLRADMSREDLSESQIPPHFTNIQHALRMARTHLATVDTPNRQIILITDGLPTAHFEESMLFLLYPPHPRTEQATMREAMACTRDGITINIFLVPSWSQSEADIRFAHRMAESTKGRVFFTAGRDLDRYVVWDYVNHRREIIG